jgi:lipopolysaccharide/colanic/teichoic acid biosynthesis glycosyltransferase
MILAAIAIKLDSRGTVFFKQERVGRRGDEFMIYKFRTMRADAERERMELMAMNETSGLFKVANDPRVTRVGRVLRKTSIDELPQLFNVLRGNMSLVGPRPLIPSEDVAITGWYRRRSQITPGITGVWQLHGPVRVPLSEMVKLDYLYVANWSWWSDIKIMLRTARHMVARRGL